MFLNRVAITEQIWYSPRSAKCFINTCTITRNTLRSSVSITGNIGHVNYALTATKRSVWTTIQWTLQMIWAPLALVLGASTRWSVLHRPKNRFGFKFNPLLLIPATYSNNNVSLVRFRQIFYNHIPRRLYCLNIAACSCNLNSAIRIFHKSSQGFEVIAHLTPRIALVNDVPTSCSLNSLTAREVQEFVHQCHFETRLLDSQNHLWWI